jgi:hypothetical protein
MIINQWIVRLKLGIDLSDEAYNLNQQDFRLVENNDHVAPYTEVTHLIYKFVDGDVYRFRLIGIVLILGVSLIPVLVMIVKSLQNRKFQIIKFEAHVFFVLSILLIPSTFGFLLLTPGYQWLVALGHSIVFSSIFLFPKLVITPRDKTVLLILVNSGVLLALLGRFSSGMLLLTICILYFVLILNKLGKNFLIFEFCIILFLILVMVLIFNIDKKIIFGLKATASLESENINLLFEITDTTMGVLVFFSILLFQFLYLRLLMKFSHGMNLLVFFPFLMFNIFVSNYLFEFWDNYFIYSQSFFLFLFTSVSGLIMALSKIRIFQLFFLIPLGCMPILSNFGSGNSIFVNEQPYYQSSIYFVIIGLVLFMQDISHKNLTKVFFLIPTLILIIAMFVKTYSNQTYGKLLKEQNDLVFYSKDSLLYSKEKIRNMNFFNYHAQLNGLQESNSVIDLSYWHPGLSRILQISPIPYGQWDKFYKSTLESQFNFVNPNNQNLFKKFSSDLMFLSIPGDMVLNGYVEMSKCYPIDSFLTYDSDLLNILKKSGSYQVKMISYYISRPEDMTLYPDYAILVKNCF